MRLYRQTLEDFGLYPQMEMDDDAFRNLHTAAGEMSAKMRAVRIVAATSVSKLDLEQRLIQKGEDPEHAKDAVQWMSDLSLVDDQKTAELIVQRCIGKGYGLARAKQALYEKRIPKEYWDRVLDSYPEQTDVIKSFLQANLNAQSDIRQKRKVIDALIRKGHSYRIVSTCLREMSLDNDEFPEDENG